MADECGSDVTVYEWECDCCLHPRKTHRSKETCDDCGAWSPQARKEAKVESSSRSIRALARSRLLRIVPVNTVWQGRSISM